MVALLADNRPCMYRSAVHSHYYQSLVTENKGMTKGKALSMIKNIVGIIFALIRESILTCRICSITPGLMEYIPNSGGQVLL